MQPTLTNRHFVEVALNLMATEAAFADHSQLLRRQRPHASDACTQCLRISAKWENWFFGLSKSAAAAESIHSINIGLAPA